MHHRTKPVGRFAPTPSGDLHIGSLIAATASCADAMHQGGEHRIRIDDIDPPRIVAQSAERIIQALNRFDVQISGEVIYQSTRLEAYEQALNQLVQLDVVFACSCSRQTLHQGHTCQKTCVKNRLKTTVPIRQQLNAHKGSAAIRLDTSHPYIQQLAPLRVIDRIQSNHCITDLNELGTPVVWRKDGYVSYLLATSVDDSEGITDVVRGADLWEGTRTQQLIIELLDRPVPTWAHVPCAVDEQQQKLGKQTRAASIHEAAALPLLQKVWTFLGQNPISCVTLEQFWTEAATAWAIDRVPKAHLLRID